MEFTRTLKQGMSGKDVRYIKDMLFELKYYPNSVKKISSSIFGSDTTKAVKSYQSTHKDTSGVKLTVDGIIGKKTWTAIERDYNASQKITYTRLLKQGMSGKDVKYMKDALFALEYYDKSIKKIDSDTFGADTVKAVKLYQELNGLTVDGIIGRITWTAIEDDFIKGQKKPEKKSILDSYTHIAEDKRKSIEADLLKVSDFRKEIVLEILRYAYDKDVKGSTRALYIFGSNLYGNDLKLNIADAKEVEAAAKKHPNYFNGGRKEWMLEQIKKNPNLPASDCSGMEVGYLRKHKKVSNTFDATANNLCTNSKHSTATTMANLIPGDWVGYNGHIGTYVGGGWVVEFAGGAYGCQLTKVDDRKVYDFVRDMVVMGTQWTRFRKPIYY